MSNDIEMSQPSTSYTAEKLYEEAYNIQYNWDKILPLDVLEFHTLVSKQTNAEDNKSMESWQFKSRKTNQNNRKHDK